MFRNSKDILDEKPPVFSHQQTLKDFSASWKPGMHLWSGVPFLVQNFSCINDSTVILLLKGHWKNQCNLESVYPINLPHYKMKVKKPLNHRGSNLSGSQIPLLCYFVVA